MTGAEMPMRLLTVFLVALIPLGACAYDRDPATPDEFATPGFKESVSEYRAAWGDEQSVTISDDTLTCLSAELGTSVESGELSPEELTLWIRGRDLSGAASDIATRLLAEGVC